jgi:hypothetical protein
MEEKERKGKENDRKERRVRGQGKMRKQEYYRQGKASGIEAEKGGR